MLAAIKALSHLHDNNIVHSDIKYTNIVKCSTDYKLIDFEGAHNEDEILNRVAATLNYAPPGKRARTN
jgi:serine/threonine protein kinase